MTNQGSEVKHIDLDAQDERIQQFVLALQLEPEGSVLELHGKPVARVLPVLGTAITYDRAKLKAAILARRDESRRLNGDWQDVDRQAWDSLPDPS